MRKGDYVIQTMKTQIFLCDICSVLAKPLLFCTESLDAAEYVLMDIGPDQTADM